MSPETASLPLVPTLVLRPAELSRELIYLRGEVGDAMESYKAVASNVLQQRWRRTTLFLTSARFGETTETALNLATALSRKTSSVLLVELQLTEPNLWQLLGQPPVASGLEEALRGEASFEKCLCRIPGESLEVVLAKQEMPAEEALRQSGSLNDFLEWAEARYEWILIDCPPVLSAGWTRWLALNADPVIMIAHAKATEKRDLRQAAKRLGDRLSGVVLREDEPVSSFGVLAS